MSYVSVGTRATTEPRLARWTPCDLSRLWLHALRLAWIRLLFRHLTQSIIRLEISSLRADFAAFGACHHIYMDP